MRWSRGRKGLWILNPFTTTRSIKRHSTTNLDKECPPIAATASFGYLRLRREAYDDELLRGWIERISKQQWDRVYVFFKHEDEGAGPRLASRFDELARESGTVE